MANIAINITVPDTQVSRMQAALRAKYGQIEDPPLSGVFRDRTSQELIAELRLRVIEDLKNTVRAYERELARKSADQGVTPIDAT